MVESLENLDNILRDWAKDKCKNSTVEALNRYEKHSLAGKKKDKDVSFLENASEKMLE